MNRAQVAIFDQVGQPFRLAERPLPERLGERQVLVRIALATICGSDLHTTDGRRQEPTPCVLGHEGVGTVIAAGVGREAWVGRRVSWTLADSCGDCPACVELELPQKCHHLYKYGHAALADGSGLNGCFASHILLRRGTHIVTVPEGMPDAMAAPANCALATMVAATEQLPNPCRTAVIQGAGLLGLYGCALLRARGVSRVVVVDAHPARLEKVTAFGGEPAEFSALNRLKVGESDFVVEATGSPAVVPEGIRLLRPGGHYVFVGMVHPDTALSLTGEAIIRGCLTLRGVHNYAPRHLDAALAFLSRERSLPWTELVSPPLPLSQIDRALALAATRQWPRVSVAASDSENVSWL